MISCPGKKMLASAEMRKYNLYMINGQKQTLKAIRQLGMSVSIRDGEYRITYPGLSRDRAEAVAYYTSDRHDALNTARAMWRARWYAYSLDAVPSLREAN